MVKPRVLGPIQVPKFNWGYGLYIPHAHTKLVRPNLAYKPTYREACYDASPATEGGAARAPYQFLDHTPTCDIGQSNFARCAGEN